MVSSKEKVTIAYTMAFSIEKRGYLLCLLFKLSTIWRLKTCRRNPESHRTKLDQVGPGQGTGDVPSRGFPAEAMGLSQGIGDTSGRGKCRKRITFTTLATHDSDLVAVAGRGRVRCEHTTHAQHCDPRTAAHSSQTMT